MSVTTSDINNSLEDFQNGFISFSSFTIALGEVFGGEMLGDSKFPTQCGDLLIFEWSTIISYNFLGDTKMKNNVVQDEL